MKILYQIKRIIKRFIIIHKNDPVKHCSIYKNSGCSHVDGMLCDYPFCKMNKN